MVLPSSSARWDDVRVDDVEKALGEAPSRAGAWERRTLQSWSPLWVLVLVVLGAGIGIGLVLVGPSGDRGHQGFIRAPGFPLWLATIAVQTALWTVVAPTLWREIVDLHRATGPARSLLALPALLTAALVLLVFARPRPDGPDSPLWAHQPKMAVLTLVAAVGVGLPALHGIALVHDRVRRHRPGGLTPADLVVAVVAQDYIRRYLATAGTVIGLAVLAAGALRRAVLLYDPGGEQAAHVPAESVLLYGAFFTALLLVVYVPAHLSLQRLCLDLREFHFPIAQMPSPTSAAFKDWVEGRDRLDAMTHAQVTPLQQLQSGVFILTPLLSAVVAGLLPDVT